MAFEPVNVHEQTEAMQELERLGINLVPATVLEGRAVHGWNPAALAELVGVPYDDTPALSPADLAECLDTVLYHLQHRVKALPDEALALQHPERPRSLRDLAYHAFRLSAAYVDCLEQGHLPEAWLQETAPADTQSGEALARYGVSVRERLSAWLEVAPPETFARTASTYYGEQNAHALLERTTWHAAQHVRQVFDLLARHGYAPADALPPEVFEGLPMPEQVW